MAGLTGSPRDQNSLFRGGLASPLSRAQYAALIWVQRRIFLNSLRTMRGSFELGARILTGFIFFAIALGPGFGMGFGAYEGAVHGRPLAIAILLWVLCAVWQGFSAVAPALAGQNPDLSYLLRFPVSLGSWVLLYLVYGIMAPSTLIGLIWAASIGIGLTIARPDLLGWTALTLALVVLFNVLLSRTILAWVERWMAQRRTREIATAVLLFVGLGAQALNPAFHHYGHHWPASHGAAHLSHRIWEAQAAFPPGMAAEALALPLRHKGGGALPLGGLALYTAGVTGLLLVRLRSESRGENFSEVRREPAARTRRRARPRFEFSGPVAAVFEKDLRYLLRSGPMLYNLAAPLVMVFLFSGLYGSGTAAGGFRHAYALPTALIWAFLGLTRIVSNSFGAEGQGMQFYYLSPTPLRLVMLGKNALHVLLFLVEAAVITGVVLYRVGPPKPSIAAATIAWLLCALPLDLAAANVLSVLMPYRASAVRMRGAQGGMGNGLLSMLAQAGIVALGAIVIAPCSLLGHPWLATPILLALALVSLVVYARVLARIDGMMQGRRETVLLEVAKTPAAS
ncbi:MAG TPA: hypothetical protein VIY53_09450 [Acidobacteriaceae bacterium]